LPYCLEETQAKEEGGETERGCNIGGWKDHWRVGEGESS
jgi:hypothetical protein